MNAAARSLSQGVWFRGQMNEMTLSRTGWGVCVLLTLVLGSALSIVYVQNLQRFYCNERQEVQNQTVQLDLEWGKLLLEKSTLITPARVQSIAEVRLNMVVPEAHTVLLMKP